MNILAKFVATIGLTATLFVASVLSMIYGWGVTAQNWWVIGGCFLWVLFVQIILEAMK